MRTGKIARNGKRRTRVPQLCRTYMLHKLAGGARIKGPGIGRGVVNGEEANRDVRDNLENLAGLLSERNEDSTRTMYLRT